MKTITKRNLKSKDLRSKNQAIIYEDSKPKYRAYERLGDMTSDDIANFLRISQNYDRY